MEELQKSQKGSKCGETALVQEKKQVTQSFQPVAPK